MKDRIEQILTDLENYMRENPRVSFDSAYATLAEPVGLSRENLSTLFDVLEKRGKVRRVDDIIEWTGNSQ